MSTYDHIVVGAGAAGCVLAARLSEDPRRRVLLLEAGKPTRRPEARLPPTFSDLFGTAVDWAYETAPEDELDGRRLLMPRGRTLGGTCVLNCQMWVPGRKEDYDGWGVAGWGWDAVGPALDRARRTLNPQPLRDPGPLTDAFLQASGQVGVPRLADLSGPDLEGAGSPLVTQRRGLRFHVGDAYLAPARSRRNLDVMTDAHVLRVLVDDGRTVGVLVRRGGAPETLRAREVVLSAGAIGSPHLLMLSGIGAADHLRAHGIDVISDLPSVGQHLQDHVWAPVEAGLRNPVSLLAAKAPRQLAALLLRRRGMLTSNTIEAAAFVRSEAGLELPDLEVFMLNALLVAGRTLADRHGITLAPIVLQPESRGSIGLASADPLRAPVIRQRFFTDPGGADLATLVRGVRFARRLLAAPALAAQITEELSPGALVRDDPDLEAAVRSRALPVHHPVGTCRLGDVVDPELRVHGVEGLRVADASVMPRINRGHTMAPAIAIGERAAELIAAGAPARVLSGLA